MYNLSIKIFFSVSNISSFGFDICCGRNIFTHLFEMILLDLAYLLYKIY